MLGFTEKNEKGYMRELYRVSLQLGEISFFYSRARQMGALNIRLVTIQFRSFSDWPFRSQISFLNLMIYTYA